MRAGILDHHMNGMLIRHVPGPGVEVHYPLPIS